MIEFNHLSIIILEKNVYGEFIDKNTFSGVSPIKISPICLRLLCIFSNNLTMLVFFRIVLKISLIITFDFPFHHDRHIF